MTNGRLIFEYRDGRNVTTIERSVGDRYKTWRDPLAHEIEAAIKAAGEDLTRAVIIPDKDDTED